LVAEFKIVTVIVRVKLPFAQSCLASAWRYLRVRSGSLFSGHSLNRRARYRYALALLAPVATLLLSAGTTADATVEAARFAPSDATQSVPYLPNLDPRFARLEKFFQEYSCPAPLYVEEYLRLADTYGLDYRLLPAISIRETQCGVHEKGNNRLGFHPSTVGFPTVLDGMEFIEKRLAEHPYYKGKSLEGKLFMYNPRPAYPGEVEWIMRQIEP
jgi:hypothetical protein